MAKEPCWSADGGQSNYRDEQITERLILLQFLQPALGGYNIFEGLTLSEYSRYKLRKHSQGRGWVEGALASSFTKLQRHCTVDSSGVRNELGGRLYVELRNSI